jgi:hypothetical protein
MEMKMDKMDKKIKKLAVKALKEARLLFTDRQRWCKNHFQMNRKLPGFKDETMNAFCVVGAIRNYIASEEKKEIRDARYCAIDLLGKSSYELFKKYSVIDVNDCLGYEAAMEVLEHAIEVGEGKKKSID